MPLQDLLNEVATLTQIQHQRFTDQLAAQVQESNISNAHAALLSALPTPDARAAFNAQDWGKLATVLPQSVDTLKELALGDYTKTHGFDPVALAQGASRLVSGEGTGDNAMQQFQAESIQNMPSVFTDGGTALHQAFLAATLGHTSPQGLLVDQMIARDPTMVHSLAASSSGTGTTAAERLQAETARNDAALTAGSDRFRTRAELTIAAGQQGIEMQKMFQQREAGTNDHAIEYIQEMQKTLDKLHDGTSTPVEQIAYSHTHNITLQKLIQSGNLPPEAGKLVKDGGWRLPTRPEDGDMAGDAGFLAGILRNMGARK